jgi:glycosyltransferase involved in cell wall biosynthesis
MKIAFLGNVCNYAYWFTKWGRSLGYDWYALIEEDPVISRDLPQWEDSEFDEEAPPPWVLRFRASGSVRRFVRGYADLRLPEMLKRFDSVHTFAMAHAIAAAAVGVPQVHHTIGMFGRYAHLTRFQTLQSGVSPRRVFTSFRYRQALRRVPRIIASEPFSCHEVVESGFGERLVRIPVAYDTASASSFASGRSRTEGEPVVFLLPARQHWELKGQDLILEAFAAIGEAALGKSRIVLMEWGIDRQRSRGLVNQLGLGEKVEYSPLLPRQELLRTLAQPGAVVIDSFPHVDFHGGALGGVSRDALSVGTPLITYAEPAAQLAVHQRSPPVLHAERTVPAIAQRIREVLGLPPADLMQIGRQGMEWMRDEFGYESVLPRYAALHRHVTAVCQGEKYG